MFIDFERLYNDVHGFSMKRTTLRRCSSMFTDFERQYNVFQKQKHNSSKNKNMSLLAGYESSGSEDEVAALPQEDVRFSNTQKYFLNFL